MRRLTHTGVGFTPAFFSADGTKLLAAIPPSHNGQLWAVDVRSRQGAGAHSLRRRPQRPGPEPRRQDSARVGWLRRHGQPIRLRRDHPVRRRKTTRYRARPVPRELERRLDLDDDRQHHRAPARAVVDDAAEGVVQVLLEELDLGHVVARSARAARDPPPHAARRGAARPPRRSRARSAPAERSGRRRPEPRALRRR